MRRSKKKYSKPKMMWDKEKIAAEKKLQQKYGLKNKREIWKAERVIKRLREQAKKLLTASTEEQAEFLRLLEKRGLIQAKNVDEVLELKAENVLNRRLQTVVVEKFKLKPKQARQAITHGHVLVSNRKVNIPSYFVDLETEKKVFYTKSSE